MLDRQIITKNVSVVGSRKPVVVPGRERGTVPMPRKASDFAKSQPYPVQNNSKHWRKRGIGVASK